ncbi:hypothetical protein K0H71_19925, partial [Bacillus sp. IITD106]|nr:hypothetical protein [Bacillus sp. IITD106]
SYFTKSYLGLIALPFYVIIPLVISTRYIISVLFTALGLLGIAWNWSPLIICIFTPALLASWGERLWWSSMQIVIVRDLIKSQLLFDKLWQKGLLAIMDQQGRLFQFNSK